MLSLRRAIQLKAQLEHRRGSRYARVLMARWDVAWASPMRLSRLPIASNAFVVPQGCVSTDVLDEPVHNTWRARVCGRVPSAYLRCQDTAVGSDQAKVKPGKVR